MPFGALPPGTKKEFAMNAIYDLRPLNRVNHGLPFRPACGWKRGGLGHREPRFSRRSAQVISTALTNWTESEWFRKWEDLAYASLRESA